MTIPNDPNPVFSGFINELITSRYQTQSALAEAIGMSDSAFSRSIHEEGTLSVANCFRLAGAAGDHPATILRTAGKPDIADIVERGLGETALSSFELEVVDLLRQISPANRRLVLRTLKAFMCLEVYEEVERERQ
jgi:transcriptional regulator with XRE-family HTH domain